MVRANATTGRPPSRGLSARQRALFARRGAEVDPTVRVLGPLPSIKNPHGGRLRIGEGTILNSDHEGSNSPIPSPVKFVLGIGATIEIGRGCQLNGAGITAYRKVTLGDRVQIGANGLICDTDFHPVPLEQRRLQIQGRPFSFESVAKAEVHLEDDVWIGYGVLVLKGVRIGRGSVVGAGSVVTRDVPPMSVVAGNPARVMGRVDGGARGNLSR